jgi:serine/threonine-protein kinase
MAELFLAEMGGVHGFAKTIVIKRILPHLAADQQFTSMFITEAKITARLDHPKIAQTYELGTEDDQLFIAMEFVDGLDALAMLRESAHRRRRLEPKISVYIIKEVLDALDFAHKLADDDGKPLKIVHRDVSPSNILISRRGDVKLVDFGIAHAAAHETKTKTGTLKGKYGYMSPEQVLGHAVSADSDVFAAGVVLAELLTGRRLFAAPNELDVLLMVRDVNLERLERFGQRVDPSLLKLIHRAPKKEPKERFADAAEFRDALDEWLFEHRHRVTPSHLAEVVEDLYEDATARRESGIAEAEIAGASVDETPTAHVAEAALSVDEAPPAEESTPSVEIELDDDPLGQIISSQAGVGDAPELGYDDIEIAIESAFEEGEELELSEESALPTFDNISAAVASVAPLSPDPSSRDFDDSDVSGANEPRLRRMPSVEEIVRLPIPKPSAQVPEGDPEGEGTLEEEPALQVLFRTTAARLTGLLVLSVGGTRKEIYFKRGIPEFVSSNVAGELFGSYLVREKVISTGELDMALAVMPHFGGKLGDTLVGLGLMKPLEVFRHLTRQVRRKLIEVCGWTRGRYHWYPGTEKPRAAFPLDLDPFEVYGAGALAIPGEAIRMWFADRGELRPQAQDSSLVVPELFQQARASELHATLDGKTSIDEFLAKSEEDNHESLRVIFLLLHTGLARDAAAS